MLELDQSITLYLNGLYSDQMDLFFYYLSWRNTWILPALLLVFFMWRQKGWRKTLIFLLFVAVMALAADQICNIFKYGVKRFRPCWDEEISYMVHIVNGDRGGKYGFFSAHAATFFGLAYMTSRFFRNNWYTIAVYLIAAIVAYSRIYLGRHYVGDVLVGAIEGTLVAWAAMHFHNKFSDKLTKKHKRSNKNN